MATVLVIEDDPDVRECIQEKLELAGYRVVTACNGREGLELLSSTDRPCVILLDLMMPVMNGYEFLPRLRDRDPDVPVVVMSAYLEHVAVPEGATEVLPKPFGSAALLDVVRRCCSPA